MKNRKIVESFNKCGPDEETKQDMLEWVLSHGEGTSRPRSRSRSYGFRNWAAACAGVVLVLSFSMVGYAAYRWLTAEQIAHNMDDDKLSEAFGKTDEEIQLKTAQGYEIAYLGSVSGRDISDTIGSSAKIDQGQTYIAVAIARTDGEDINLNSPLLVTPLIQGLEPWKYNIYTLGQGSAQGIISDGTLYWLMETNNIEMFSDRMMYVGVTLDSAGLQGFQMDADTGLISENPGYEGLHVLFTMDREHMNADPAAAEIFLSSLQAQWDEEADAALDWPEEYSELKYHDMVWKDEQAGLKITFPFYNKIHGSSYGFYCQVEGSGIKNITYSLNNGEFIHKSEFAQEEWEEVYFAEDQEKYIGFRDKECILKPEEHDNAGCEYTGSQDKTKWLYEKAASSYTVNYNMQKDAMYQYAVGMDEAETPAEALAETTVTMTIQYEDGSTIQKHITFEEITDLEESIPVNFVKVMVMD